MKPETAMEEKKEKKIHFQVMDGKIYFSRSAERLFYLIMTAVMAAIGLIADIPFI